ncbi:S-fimbrial adhesin minor subunit SfaS [Escherichia coli]|uniref:S-fimbrial adhesin minor subunit SfaS n=1 Tax=Escherichia coli TaxID=562 RepID=UPI002280901B|nr:S-fimbrial adhesin minor subunit SfaS [Escherichia coli]MCZ0137237.1 S-fimbrial adhesin minor subunit SfaS [Escherichia coli]
MKLKAIILATGLINCIAFSAQAVDTTITVTGNVLQRTCNVPGNVDVSLGNLYVSDFPNAGSGSPWVNFDLSLTGCQNMNTVRATFSGTADGQTYYANTGNAGGIMIEIQDRDGSNASYHNGMFKTLNVQNNNATFNLKARAVSKGQVTPGNISSVITVTYTYA